MTLSTAATTGKLDAVLAGASKGTKLDALRSKVRKTLVDGISNGKVAQFFATKAASVGVQWGPMWANWIQWSNYEVQCVQMGCNGIQYGSNGLANSAFHVPGPWCRIVWGPTCSMSRVLVKVLGQP